VATISSLVSRVRLELGDTGKTFVENFVADGTTNRFELGISPIDATTVIVKVNNVDVSSTSYIEESTGILTLTDTPVDMSEILVTGTYYRYFTASELGQLVTDAVAQHSAGHTDSVGRTITVDTLPAIEEYPVSIYAVTLALYTLATDASFDIDIAAPDGVSIPRSERYRQLMEMVAERQAQYRDLCVQLGVGLYKIDVFTMRRISKATGRYIPVYRPQEVDDRSYPQRVHEPLPTYGDKAPVWPTTVPQFTAYQGRAWTTTIDFSGSYTGFSFICNLLNQRGSVLVVQHINLSVLDHGDGTYTATVSLTADQTLRLAERTYLSLSTVNDATAEQIEIVGSDFYTTRVSEVIL
jgi:hypothetical protein